MTTARANRPQQLFWAERQATVASEPAEVTRLSGLIARQRSELDSVRAQAAARSVLDLARGILMERLGCSLADASRQLGYLSEQSGTSLADLAAQIAGQPRQRGENGDAPVRPLSLAEAAAEQAGDGAALAAALLDIALGAAGAVAVAIWVTAPEGGLELAGQAGFGDREAGRWRWVHPDMDSPIRHAAHCGQETWWPHGRPEQDNSLMIGSWPGGASVVLPLGEAGVTLGSMAMCWPEPVEDFPGTFRAQLLGLAELSAQVLGGGLPHGAAGADHRASWVFGLLDGLLESALFAQALRDDDGQVRDFRLGYLSSGFRDPAGRNRADLAGRPMLEVYPAAAMAGGLFDQAVQVLSTGKPRHIAGEIITVFAGDATVSPVMEVRIARLFDGVVVSWRRADEVERLSAHLQQASRLGRIGSWEENVLSGEVRWTEPAFALFGRQQGAPLPVAKLHTLVIDDDVPVVERFRDMLLREQKRAAAMFRVVRADDGSVRQMRAVAEPVTDPAGTLIAVRGAYQDVSADHHMHVAFAAAREQLADSEQRAEEERLLATRLQHAITPRTAAPVEAGGLTVAARYLPAGPPSLVCGDWYDAVMLPSKEVLLVVGDVAGHGIDAVTGMVALRNALRGLAMTGATPGTLIGWLNAAACHLTDGIVGTALCGIYDPGSRTLHWARAGHLPPIVMRAGTAQPLELPDGVLLGADPAASYEEATTSLQPGDILLLYTDGLIERRDESLDNALRSLLRVASQAQPDIGVFADHLVAHSPANTLDDACLVAVQVD